MLGNFDPRELDKCEPDYWFLNEDDSRYLSFRAKAWDRSYDLTGAYTSDNLVTPSIDGAAYMGDLFHRLSDLNDGDYVYMVGWQFTPDQYLLEKDAQIDNPSDDETAPLLIPAPHLTELLEGLIASGVDVRAMAFWPPTVLASAFSKLLGNLAPLPQGLNDTFASRINKAGGKAILDSKLADATLIPRSHHQKVLVLRSGHSYCAYVGGIDLGSDRWDTPDHTRDYKEATFFGWHDIQCLVQGDAVRQIWANFADRWNDQAKPADAVNVASMPPAGTKPGRHHVQVLRTYGTGTDSALFGFMPNGEQTIRQAYLKAISKAEHYIYFEEQFPYMCDIADAIRQRLVQVPDLKVICVLASGTDIPLSLGQYSLYLRRQFLETLAPGGNYGDASRVYPYHLWQNPATLAHGQTDKMIYVHTKILLIDDRYVAIGSANLNKRSMTSDSELQIAVVDDETVDGGLNLQGGGTSHVSVCRFAQDLRRRLWSEHLGIDSPVSVTAALALWPTWQANSNTQMHHVKVLTPEQGAMYTGLTADMVIQNFDPDTPEWAPKDGVWVSK